MEDDQEYGISQIERDFIVWLIFSEKTLWVENKRTDMVFVVGFSVMSVNAVACLAAVSIASCSDRSGGLGIDWGEGVKCDMNALGNGVCGGGV